QTGEERYDSVLKPARTQLRDAVVTTVGREFATWAHAIGRDRWRCFKARERIREVNLGGTAVGTGAGAPRTYVLQVVQVLQRLTPHPVCRADHLVEATSNWDQVVEAMESVRTVAVNLRRIAHDIRLLASGPETAIGEFYLPQLMRGSSIMAGKVNPVVPESVIQAAERILANDGLIARLAASTELELNAFFPALAFTIEESLIMARGAADALCDYVSRLEVDSQRCAANVAGSAAAVVALLPLVPYGGVEVLLRGAGAAGKELQPYLTEAGLLSEEDAEALFAPENLMSLGYNEARYAAIRERSGAALESHIATLGGAT
ncbi:MAG TPA: lyase family protein, partial [Alkalispirochaeta sp.]|nr:lyase family protein [Alkalispirochaeta sp.]